MAIEIKYALNMALQYNNANEFDIEDYLLADNETGKFFLTEAPTKRVLNEAEKSALYFLIDDSLFNASAMYEMYDSGNNKIAEFIIELGYNHLIHNAIPVNVSSLPVPIDASRIDVSIVSNQNFLTFESEFDNAAWTKASGGTGSNPVVTANFTTAPDGTTTADRIVFDSGAGITSSDQSIISQSPIVPAGDYNGSIYLKGAIGGEQLLFRHVSGGSYTLLTLTTEWEQYSVTESRVVNNFELGIRQAVPGTINSSVTIYAWGAQLSSDTNNYLTEIKSYQIDRECYDYLFQVNWLNKLGGRDTFMFGAKPIIETSVDRNNLIELSKLRNFESPKRIYGYREHISRKTYTLSHRCKDRDTAEWVKRELIDSIDVMMVINDYYYPVLVLNSSIQEDKVSHDYIVTFQLRLAFDNNIQTR